VTGGPARVLIADDHAPTRDELRRVLEQDGRFAVVAEASNAFGAIEDAVREQPDVCLLDVQMPGGGIAATWEISGRIPQTKVVIFTVSADSRTLLTALRAGAHGYLLKDMDTDRLPHALHDVLLGETAMPRRLVAELIDEFRDRGPRRRGIVAHGPESQLTSREWQVLDLLRQELGTSEIARRLVLSPITVRTHVNSILRKLRVPDRATLVRELADR
jgi:two-component system, NarL family, nitrate/nitrite response regulator NarL